MLSPVLCDEENRFLSRNVMGPPQKSILELMTPRQNPFPQCWPWLLYPHAGGSLDGFSSLPIPPLLFWLFVVSALPGCSITCQLLWGAGLMCKGGPASLNQTPFLICLKNFVE